MASSSAKAEVPFARLREISRDFSMTDALAYFKGYVVPWDGLTRASSLAAEFMDEAERLHAEISEIQDDEERNREARQFNQELIDSSWISVSIRPISGSEIYVLHRDPTWYLKHFFPTEDLTEKLREYCTRFIEGIYSTDTADKMKETILKVKSVQDAIVLMTSPASNNTSGPGGTFTALINVKARVVKSLVGSLPREAQLTFFRYLTDRPVLMEWVFFQQDPSSDLVQKRKEVDGSLESLLSKIENGFPLMALKQIDKENGSKDLSQSLRGTPMQELGDILDFEDVKKFLTRHKINFRACDLLVLNSASY